MDLRRVTVIGTSCSGKTALAKRLATRLGSPHIELDAMYWRPNWKSSPPEEFRDAVTSALQPDRWILEGNYSQIQDVVWPRATAVVWLNYAFPLVFSRALRRTVRRIASREELFSGNRETFRMGFLSRESILLWVIRTHGRNRRRYRALLGGSLAGILDVIELQRPRQTEDFLRSVESQT